MPTILTSNEVIGKKEQVADTIFKLYMDKTPFISSLKKEKATNTLYQWLEDSLATPTKIARADGADAVDTQGTQPVLRDNVTQILSDVVKISRTSDTVSKYGRDTETNRLVLKAGVQLRVNLEHSAVGTAQTKANTTTTREFAGVQAMIDSANKIDSPNSSILIGEGKFLDAMQAVYNAGGTPTVVTTNGNGIREISGWAYSSGRSRDFGNEKTLVNVVDLLVTPFGQVKVVLNTVVKDKDTIIYNPADWRLMVLQEFQKEALAKVGDSERTMVVGEYGLKHNAFKASALITTSTVPPTP